MKNRCKWRAWIKAIDKNIYMPIRFFTPIYREYISILESNAKIREPFHFHEWILYNHSQTLLLTLRKISDDDERVYSVRRLLGSIYHDHKSLNLHSYMHGSKKIFRENILNYWNSVCGNSECISKGIVQEDMNKISTLTAKACKAVNEQVAHIAKNGKNRAFEYNSVYADLKSTLQIFQKYSILLKCPVDDSLEATIPYDWQSVFRHCWIQP
jgi:hypothetical protein